MGAWCALIQNQRGKNGRYRLRPGSRKIPGGSLGNAYSRARVSPRRHASPLPLKIPLISVPQTQASRAARRGKIEQASWRPFHPSLLGSPLAEHPLASLPRFIDPPGGRCVPLPFKQVHYVIHPLVGAIPVLPEILEGLHLASQRLRSRAQSPVQSAPAIRQGLAPAGGAAPGTRSTKLFFPSWHSEPREKIGVFGNNTGDRASVAP